MSIALQVRANPEWSKNSYWSQPRARNHCPAHVADKSCPGGLLPGEFPGILNIICADCEPMVRGPVDFYSAFLSYYFCRPPSRSRHRTAPMFLLAYDAK